VYLQGNSGGSAQVTGGKLNLSISGTGIFGLYHPTTAKQCFFAEATYDADDAIGVAVIRMNNGQPDLNNWVMISVMNNGGTVTVNALNKKNESANSFQFGGKEERLTGTRYSVPFTTTDKVVRIFREGLSGT
jgi:hypothetical protein